MDKLRRQILTSGLAAFGTWIASKAIANAQPNDKEVRTKIAQAKSNDANVNGIRLHYVTAGQGEPIFLLHGYPETHHTWHKVIPILAQQFKVIAPDLRGLGDSERPASGYDKRTIAEDIYQLGRSLGYKSIYLVGHDYGGTVAYFLAAAHPEFVKRLVVIEAAPAGLGETEFVPLVQGGGAWFRAFHLAPDLPEALVAGRERIYLSWLYRRFSKNPEAISPSDLDEYVRTYSKPGAMKAGFEYYRTYFEDKKYGEEYAKTKLQMPVLAIGGEDFYGAAVEKSLKLGAVNVKGITIQNSGHFVPEEQPQVLAQHLIDFATAMAG
jgi:pimeloyl-ACP methyl ester carboxylesterase